MNKDYKPWKNYESQQRNNAKEIAEAQKNLDYEKRARFTAVLYGDDFSNDLYKSYQNNLKKLIANNDQLFRKEFAEHKSMADKDHFMSKHGSPKDKRLARRFIKSRVAGRTEWNKNE